MAGGDERDVDLAHAAGFSPYATGVPACGP